MGTRWAMPIVGEGVQGSPIRPKYDCLGRDMHINYVLAQGVAVVALKGPEAPPWADAPDVQKLDEVSDEVDMSVLQYLPPGIEPVVLPDEVDESATPSSQSGDEPIDPDLSGPQGPEGDP
jgi:hypothetical protein